MLSSRALGRRRRRDRVLRTSREDPTITPASIGGAKLGLAANAYKALLGRPYRFEAAKGGDFTLPGFQQPSDYTRIVFPKRKIDVYFNDGIDKAIEITTWNRSYKTAAGVGPSSTPTQLKQACGKRAKPTPGNFGTVYHVDRSLLFELKRPKFDQVTSIAIFDATKPNWNKPGHELYYAAFVAANRDNVRCP